MKAKQIVDKIIDFYKTPGNNAGKNEEGTGCYFVDSNTKCAVGCLVQHPELLQEVQDDEELYNVISIYNYAKEAERNDIVEDLKAILPEDIPTETEQLAFLSELQHIHDTTSRHDEFADELAKRYATDLKEKFDVYL